MLTSDRRDGVLTVTIDRPSRRNALRSSELEALDATVRTADAKVLYLTGSEGTFCAGADLAEIDQLDGEKAEAFARRDRATARTTASVDPIVVAGIDGPARGGGVELALACDIHIATASASFAETGVGIGLFGAWGGTHRLPAIVGLGNALDRERSRCRGGGGLRMGLVSLIVDDPFDTDVLSTLKGLVKSNKRPRTCEREDAEAFARVIDRRAP